MRNHSRSAAVSSHCKWWLAYTALMGGAIGLSMTAFFLWVEARTGACANSNPDLMGIMPKVLSNESVTGEMLTACFPEYATACTHEVLAGQETFRYCLETPWTNPENACVVQCFSTLITRGEVAAHFSKEPSWSLSQPILSASEVSELEHQATWMLLGVLVILSAALGLRMVQSCSRSGLWGSHSVAADYQSLAASNDADRVEQGGSYWEAVRAAPY